MTKLQNLVIIFGHYILLERSTKMLLITEQKSKSF